MLGEFEQILGSSRVVIAGALVVASVILGLFSILLSRYLARRRLRIFLHQPLPCSVNRSCFIRSKSLFDILLDLGLSMDSLVLVSESLGWIPAEGHLDHHDLNESVEKSVAAYSTYASFVTAMKTHLQGLPMARSSNLVPSHAIKEQKSSKAPGHPSFERLIEERRAFNSMILALRDQTKSELARRLGITHRFDYLTTEVFRSVGESENRHIVASLDYETHSTTDLFIAFGQLSAMAGASLWAIGSVSEVLVSAAEAGSLAVGLDTEGVEGGFEGFEGLEELGELALIIAAVSLTVGTVKKISKLWRERHLRHYQDEFKHHMEALSAIFFAEGEEAALRVPRLVIHALELEVSRLYKLVRLLQRKPLSSGPNSIKYKSPCSSSRNGRTRAL